MSAADRAARLAVDRRIGQILATIPCFCTPQRPEFGREEWYAKHAILARLDRAALAAEVQQLTLDAG